MKKLFLMAAAILALVACSGGPAERQISVSNPDFSGFSKKYLEVVDGDYKFTTEGDEGKITLKFRKKANPDEPFYSTGRKEFRLNAVGDAGEIFDTGVYGFEADYNEFNKIEDLLTNGEIGETRSVCFTWRYMGQKDSRDIRNKIYNSAITIELIDDGFKAGVKPESYSSSSSDDEVADVTEEDIIMLEAGMEDIEEDEDEDVVTESKSPKMSSAEIDKFLDNYEKTLNSALKYLKKAQSGDASALAEYNSFMQKYRDMEKQAKNLSLSEMSSSQVTRLQKIFNDYAQSLQSLY